MDSLDVDVTEALKNEGVDDAEVSETKEAKASVDEENSGSAKTEADVAGDIKATGGVASEAEESQYSEARVDDVPVSEKPDSTNVDVGEVDGAEVTSQGDSLMDKIIIDVIEAIRSGAIVVGEDEIKNVEANENGSAVDDSIGAGLESNKHDFDIMDVVGGQEKIVTSQRDSVADKLNVDVVEAIRSGVVVVGEHEERKGIESEAKENGFAANEGIGVVHDSIQHDFDTMDFVPGQEQISGSVDNLAAENSLDVPEASSEDLKREVLEKIDGNVNVVSARGGENLQEVHATDDVVKANDEELHKSHLSELTEEGDTVRSGVMAEAKVGDKPDSDEEDGSTDGENDGLVFGSSAAARQFIQELERASRAGSQVGAGNSHEHSQVIDGQIVTDSEEEVESDNEQDGQELFDSAALASLLKAATSASVDPGNLTITSQYGTRLFYVEHPAGLGSSLRSVRPSA